MIARRKSFLSVIICVMHKSELHSVLEKELRALDKNFSDAAKNFSLFLNPNEQFGQYGSNLLILLAKKSGKSLEKTFEVLKEKIFSKPLFQESFEKIEPATNGFLNFYLSKNALFETFQAIFQGKKFPYVQAEIPKKVQIEYVSANPVGPLTLHNTRGAILGDTIANVLGRSGHKIHREFYVNDRGGQIKTLGLSILAAHGLIKEEETFYRGGYLKSLEFKVKSLERFIEKPEELGKIAAREILTNLIQKPLEEFGTHFDTFYSENELYKKGLDKEVLKLFADKKLTYKKDGALYFKSTLFGDNEDRVLVKSDGEATYFLSDAAYHLDKFRNRKFEVVIDIFGADHQSHKDRLYAIVKALELGGDFQIIIMQFVHLKSGEELMRMSKRKGVYLALDDLVKEVGKDAVRFFFLMTHHNTHLDFDVELAKRKSQENPVYYVQYAYARLCSIFEKAGLSEKEIAKQDPKKVFEYVIQINNVRNLLSKMHGYFDLISDVSKSLEVNKLATFALEFAAQFHQIYERTRIIDDNKIETKLRLSFALAVKNFLKELFDVIGIEAREKM